MITRLYAALVCLYPRQYRVDFAEEMQAVFEEAAAAQIGRGSLASLFLREIRDLPGSLIEAYVSKGIQRENMSIQNEHISSSTRWQAFVGALPFLVFGASSMINKVDHIYNIRGLNVEMVVYALALTGLLIGWIRGFPLWSYSYLGWSLTLAWSNTNMWINGVDWGYRIWIPFGITVLIALLWKRSLSPIKKIIRDISNDWSRLSLAMYTFIAFVGLIYDENHHPYLFIFISASTLVTAGAAWLSLRSPQSRARILILIAGFIIPMIISSISSATWDWHEYNGIPKIPTTWYKEVWNTIMRLLFWGIILFWPAIIDLIRRRTTRRTA